MHVRADRVSGHAERHVVGTAARRSKDVVPGSGGNDHARSGHLVRVRRRPDCAVPTVEGSDAVNRRTTSCRSKRFGQANSPTHGHTTVKKGSWRVDKMSDNAVDLAFRGADGIEPAYLAWKANSGPESPVRNCASSTLLDSRNLSVLRLLRHTSPNVDNRPCPSSLAGGSSHYSSSCRRWASHLAHSSSDASLWWRGVVPTASRTSEPASAQWRIAAWKPHGRLGFRARERFSASLCQSVRGYRYPG